jgi:hypothetical protein
MKASELRPCDICKRGLVDGGSIVFWSVTLESLVLDASEIRQTAAMEMMFPGAPGLARTFYDGEVAKSFSTETRLVCGTCLTSVSLAELTEAKTETEVGR